MNSSTTFISDVISTYLYLVVMPILFLFGVVGNLISFVIYSRDFFAKSSTSFYLRALSIVELLTVFMALGHFFENGLNLQFKSYSNISCKIGSYYTYIFCAISAQIRTFISFERMLSIIFPNKFKFLNSRKLHYLTMIVIFSFNLIIYTPILVYFQTFEINEVVKVDLETFNQTIMISYSNISSLSSVRICLSYFESYDHILLWYDLVNSTLIPFILMLLFTIAIINSLNRSRNKIINKSSNDPTANKSAVESVKKREQKDFQFALTSILICFAFFLFNIGILFFKLLYNYDVIKFNSFYLLWTIFRILFYLDYSSKIFIYLIANKRFRYELRQLLLIK